MKKQTSSLKMGVLRSRKSLASSTITGNSVISSSNCRVWTSTIRNWLACLPIMHVQITAGQFRNWWACLPRANSVTIRNWWACLPIIHIQLAMGQFSDNQEFLGLLAYHTSSNYNGPIQCQSGIYGPACLSYIFKLQCANSVTIRNWWACLPRANSVTIRNWWACLPIVHIQITMGQFSDNQELMGLLAFHTRSN